MAPNFLEQLTPEWCQHHVQGLERLVRPRVDLLVLAERVRDDESGRSNRP